MTEPYTYLINIKTGARERHSLSQAPSYIALSHTWSDDLFAVGKPLHSTAGHPSLEKVLTLTDFQHIQHCWTDTICIDQNDPADKERQIPLMGEIYGKAVVVAIITRENFGLTQARIDKVMREVSGAVQMSKEGSWLEHGASWNQNDKYRKYLKDAMDILERFARPTWGTRVWTMQEFILAKRMVWIGSDLVPLIVDERLFEAIPDVCNHLSMEECIGGKYAKVFAHFSGMAGAHCGLIDKTRVIELLGNKKATVPEDEIFGLMAASGVILGEDDLKIKGRERVWALWWEKALLSGHLRWALLPPATSTAVEDMSWTKNCIMPAFATRHLASSTSLLDRVEGLGPCSIKRGTVTMTGRTEGICSITSRLGKIYIDATDTVHRDIMLILFARKDFEKAKTLAAAFGAGRYNRQQRVDIARVLEQNYFRAKYAVQESRERAFRPVFDNSNQLRTWSDFMLLQATLMPVMNDGIAFLAKLYTVVSKSSTYIIIVTGGEKPSGHLAAIDFGAVNESDKTMLTVVQVPQATSVVNLAESCASQECPSLHRVGVSMYIQFTTDAKEVRKYASHLRTSDSPLESFRLGGQACATCPSGKINLPVASKKQALNDHGSTYRKDSLTARQKLKLRCQVRKEKRQFHIRAVRELPWA